MCFGPAHAHCPEDGAYGRKKLAGGAYGRKKLAGGTGGRQHQQLRNGSGLLDKTSSMVTNIRHRQIPLPNMQEGMQRLGTTPRTIVCTQQWHA